MSIIIEKTTYLIRPSRRLEHIGAIMNIDI